MSKSGSRRRELRARLAGQSKKSSRTRPDEPRAWTETAISAPSLLLHQRLQTLPEIGCQRITEDGDAGGSGLFRVRIGPQRRRRSRPCRTRPALLGRDRFGLGALKQPQEGVLCRRRRRDAGRIGRHRRRAVAARVAQSKDRVMSRTGSSRTMPWPERSIRIMAP